MEWKVGRDGDYGAQCVAGGRARAGASICPRETRRGMDLFQTPSRRSRGSHATPSGREAAALHCTRGLPTESLFCHRRRDALPRARLLLSEREQQWRRRRSSYDFTVVRSLVFSSTFSRGERGWPAAAVAISRPTDLTERAHYTCTFGHNTVFGRVF